jgi:hypothetical protein|tara:strand:- start:197 stop:892 length:696 start_codon:yes stop_codon:yes gene_type:complete
VFSKYLPLFIGIFFLISFASIAQGVPNLGQTDRWMKGALAAMERQDYTTANSIFRNLIDSGLPLPEEMPYYFAETLYQLGQYDNSSNFLNKYLEINGFRGANYQGAQELQKKLEGPLKDIIQCQLCDRKGYRLEPCSNCGGKQKLEQSCTYCRGKGIVGCSKCAATGMITKRNIFNIVEYFECDRCGGDGRLTCPNCQGSLKEISECKVCGGTGSLSTELICNHQKIEHKH